MRTKCRTTPAKLAALAKRRAIRDANRNGGARGGALNVDY